MATGGSTGEVSLSTHENHNILKLRDAVNSWASEVAQTRSSLAHELDAPSNQPLFKLIRSPHDAAALAEDRRALEQARRDLMIENSALMCEMEELEARVSASSDAAAESERESLRLQSEISYAREQMHIQNAASQETTQELSEAQSELSTMREQLESNEITLHEMEARLADIETQAEADLAALQQKIRVKDWRLLKSDNEIEQLREDVGRQREELETVVPELASAREDIEKRERVQLETLSTLETERTRARSLEEALASSRARVEELSRAIQSLWNVFEGNSAQPAANFTDVVPAILPSVPRLDDADAGEAEPSDIEGVDLASELMLAQEALSSLRIEFEELYDSRERLRKALSEQEEAPTSDVSAQLKQAEEDLRLRKSMESDTARELELANQVLTDLRSQYEELLTSNTELHKEIANRGEEGNFAEMASLKGTREELVERDAALYALQSEFETVQSSLARLRGEHNELMSMHNVLREESADSRAAREAAESRAEAAEALVAEMSEEDAIDEGRVEQLTQDLVDRTNAFEALEGDLKTVSEQLTSRDAVEETLREEMQVSQIGFERNTLEQDVLVRALKGEMEALRQVAIDKDFVIFHAEAEMGDLKQRETDMTDRLQEVIATSERLHAESAGGQDIHRSLKDEIKALQDGAHEKDAALREMRREVLTLRSRLHQFLADSASGNVDNFPSDNGSPLNVVAQGADEIASGVSQEDLDDSEDVAHIMRLWKGKRAHQE